MLVDMTLPRNGVEADVVGYDSKGNKVEVVRLEITPYFFKTTASPVVCYSQVVDDSGKSVSRAAVVLAARTGRLHAADLTTATKPIYYSQGTAETTTALPTTPKKVEKSSVSHSKKEES